MWSIEVSSEASEEEIEQTLLEELDFDYIRECVAELKMIVQKYGPFKEVVERAENTITKEITRTYDHKRGWICDQLASIDSQKVWTLIVDQWNGMSWISSGYSQESSGAKEITSWFIADKPIEQEDSSIYPNTEFLIAVTYEEEEDEESYFSLDLWSLIDTDEVSDEAIMGALAY